MKRLRWILVGAMFLVLVGTAANYAQSPAAAAPRTLWRFLGIPQAFQKMNANLVNRRGNFPGLERKPPLKALSDPSNLEANDSATKVAAQIKRSEDEKPQKVKAIKYLASIGCGCHNRHGEVSGALFEALDDCTEEVRYEAALAIAESAKSGSCVNCEQRGCCAPAIVRKLSNIAYAQDANGCWTEPSARVRRAAIAALEACGPIVNEPLPTPATPPEPGAKPNPPESLNDESTSGRLPPVEPEGEFIDSGPRRLPPTASSADLGPDALVRDVSPSQGLIEIVCRESMALPATTRLQVAPVGAAPNSAVAEFVVVASRPGSALARPVGRTHIGSVAVGDPVRFLP